MYIEPQFKDFPKITRFYEQDVCITEKIDGTNGLIWIGDNPMFDQDFDPQTQSMMIKAGSRSRWITPENDNYGFARWVEENKEELMKLGPGYHYGEWWGNGIQRKYGMNKKVFSLFNVYKWADDVVRPTCCDVVPTLYLGPLTPEILQKYSYSFEKSVAAEKYDIEFDDPEGTMMYFTKAGHYYKAPNDKGPKG